MPKRKTAKNKPAPTSWVNNVKHPVVFYKNLSLWYKLFFWIGVFLFILILITAAKNLSYQQSVEQNFKKLETNIKPLQDEIQKKHPEISLEENKFCSRYSAKFSEGNMYCLVGFSTAGTYNALSKDKAYLTPSQVSFVKEILSKQEFLHEHGGDSTVVYYETSNDIGCRLDVSTADGALNTYTLAFSCRQNSKEDFYPYQD